MNVLILAPELSTLGGKQSYFLAIKDHFSNNIQFFTYGTRGKKESHLNKIFRMISDYRTFGKELRSGKWDLVHLNPSMNRNSFFRDSIFMFLTIRYGIRSVVFWHGWNWSFVNKTVPNYKFWFKRTFAKANASIILANEFKKKLSELGTEGPIHLETTVVDDYIPEGINEDFAVKKAKEKDPINLLFLARVEEAKGIFESLEAYSNVKKDFPRLKLLIAGKGGAFEKMKSHIEQHAIPDVEVLGFINGETKRNILHKSHIYLFPSTYGEGLPLSLLEAMSCGMPVITTLAGGIKDFFQEANMGVALSGRNANELEKGLRKLLTNPQLRENIAKNNFKYASEVFAANKVTERLEKIYSRAVAVKENSSSNAE